MEQVKELETMEEIMDGAEETTAKVEKKTDKDIIAELKAKIKELKEENKEAVQELKAEIREVKKSHKEEIAEIKAAAQERLKETRAKRDEGADDLKERRDALNAELREVKAALKEAELDKEAMIKTIASLEEAICGVDVSGTITVDREEFAKIAKKRVATSAVLSERGRLSKSEVPGPNKISGAFKDIEIRDIMLKEWFSQFTQEVTIVEGVSSSLVNILADTDVECIAAKIEEHRHSNELRAKRCEDEAEKERILHFVKVDTAILEALGAGHAVIISGTKQSLVMV